MGQTWLDRIKENLEGNSLSPEQTTAYNQGYSSKVEGYSVVSNPYTYQKEAGISLWDCWMAGYSDADFIERQKVSQ